MSETMKVPFLDLATPHAELREELCEVFQSTLKTAGFIGGPIVEGFERDFAKFCDSRYCVGVGSGTDALRFMFIAAGIGNADVIVTVPNTFIATTEAISQTGPCRISSTWTNGPTTWIRASPGVYLTATATWTAARGIS